MIGDRRIRVAAIATILVSLCSCSASSDTAKQFGSSRDSSVVVVPSEKRSAPVVLAGSSVSGAPISLASMANKVVVVNVWGSWCPPCRKEAGALQRAYETLNSSGVEFLGINVQDNRSAAQAFQHAFGITFPSIFDDGGVQLLALRGAVPPNAIPTTLVLDSRHRIAARISGETTEATLIDVINQAKTT